MIRRRLLLLLMLCCATPAWAVSISGVMVYSADDFGTPSGFDTFDRPEAPEMHMWRSYAAGKWHSLAIYEGLPPQSITGKPRPLNAGNFSVDIPLIEGENFFTIVGEPGPITATDTYDGFVVNLYFDGGLNTPGISALFPRYGSEEGAPTRTNRSPYIYSFDVTLAQQRSPGVDDTGLDIYDDGIEKVTVTGASFLPEDRFVSVDLIGGQKFGQSGTADFVGSLVILVEPSEGGPGVDSSGSGRGGAVGGTAGGVRPRSAIAGGPGGGSAPFVPGNAAGAVRQGGFADDVAAGAGRAGADDGFEWVSGDKAADDDPDAGDAEDDAVETPTPKDIVGALREWIDTGVEETPTPEVDADAADAGTATPTPAFTTVPVTPTPKATSIAGTPSPAGTPATPSPTKTPSPDATATMGAAMKSPVPGTTGSSAAPAPARRAE
jgi:hypothetical protein